MLSTSRPRQILTWVPGLPDDASELLIRQRKVAHTQYVSGHQSRRYLCYLQSTLSSKPAPQHICTHAGCCPKLALTVTTSCFLGTKGRVPALVTEITGFCSSTTQKWQHFLKAAGCQQQKYSLLQYQELNRRQLVRQLVTRTRSPVECKCRCLPRTLSATCMPQQVYLQQQ